jgi:protein-S-isoprenylcysteine O-methyltransferase Ste14
MPETANTARIAAAIARRRVPLGFAFGALVILLARPTPRSLMIGGAVALVGEACRIWAAGHLEKGLEVTRSGPYRFTSHPLYIGSAIIAAGVAIAASRFSVATVVLCYIAATTVAAIRHEEEGMRARFGDQYDAYLDSRAQPIDRPFSLGRAIRNKEHRSLAGLAVVAVIFALKAALLSR